MNPEILDALVAWIDGKNVNEILRLLQNTKNASSIRDLPTLSKYLWAKSNGLT